MTRTTPEQRAELARLVGEALPDGWHDVHWYGNVDHPSVQLSTWVPGWGRTSLMRFERWGMQSGQPWFLDAATRMMTKGADLVTYEVAPRAVGVKQRGMAYRGDITGFTHPFPQLLVALLNALPDLLADLEDAEAERDSLTEGVRAYGRTIDRWGKLIIEATGSEDITTPDGDGDWEVVEHRLSEVRAEQERLTVALRLAQARAADAETETRLLKDEVKVWRDLALREERAGQRRILDLAAERDALAAKVEWVRALAHESDDGTEWEHVPDCQGDPTCPACWTADIRRALDESEG